VFEILITGSPRITVTFSECECNAQIHRQASLVNQPTFSTTSKLRVGSGRTAIKKLTNRGLCSLDVLLDVDRTTWVFIVVCYPRVATRGGSAVVNWMTVVEEPAEGELIEAVVVAVDVLVALRPAITIVTNLKGRKRKK